MTRLELAGTYQGEPLRLTYGAGGWSGWPFMVLDELDVMTGRPLDLTATGPTVRLRPDDLLAVVIYLERGLGVRLDPTSRSAFEALWEADVRVRIPPGAVA